MKNWRKSTLKGEKIQGETAIFLISDLSGWKKSSHSLNTSVF